MNFHLESILQATALALVVSTSIQAAPTWTPEIYPDNQIFPSLILSTARLNEPEEVLGEWTGAHLGDPVGLIGVYLEDASKGAKVEITVKANKFIEGGSFVGTLPSQQAGWTIHPKVAYNFDALAANHQPRPANVTLSVSVDGKPLGDQTTTVDVRSINDCLFGVAEDESTDSDYCSLFAAYVNENHPWVDKILRDALELGIVDSFDGYQSEDEDQVMLQVYAIWDAMQRRGFHYCNITTTSFDSEKVYSQHVRLFADSINAKQANCVDGTVLFAAILRKIGLSPYLVTIPGHMFLAVDLDEASESWVGIETTVIGAGITESEPADEISDAVRDACSEIESWPAFESAIALGTEELADHSDEFEDEDNYASQIVDVAAARELGIQPISSDAAISERD